MTADKQKQSGKSRAEQRLDKRAAALRDNLKKRKTKAKKKKGTS